VAGSVDALGMGNALYDAVVALPDDAGLIQAGFDQLSGEVQATARGVLLADSRIVRDAISQRIGAAFGGVGAVALPVMAYGEGGIELAPATTERLALWGQAFGSWGREQGDDNAHGVSRSLGGVLAGGDVAVNDVWRLGLLTGYSHDRFDSDGRASSGASDNYHLGLYGGGQWGAFGLRGGAAYSFSRVATVRAVALPGFADRLSASYDAGTTQLFGEAAYRIDTTTAAFEPFANLAYVNVRSDGFAEDGGAAAVRADGATSDATFTTLGVRAQAEVALGGVDATARGLLGWRHAFGKVTPTATLALAGGAAFTVAGTPLARDAAVLEAGLDFRLTPAATLGLAYSGQLASRAHDNGVRADLSVRF
jgi:outer membrane autotransporter protein